MTLQTSLRMVEVLLPVVEAEPSTMWPPGLIMGPTWPFEPVYSSEVLA